MTIGQQAASTARPCVSFLVSACSGVLKRSEYSKVPSIPNSNEMQPLLQEA